MNTTSTVLVVEDQAIFRDTMVQILAKQGYEVLEASTKEEALSMVDTRVIDLVFLDLGLSEHDAGKGGRAVFDRLQETAPLVPVVIVTSDATAQSALELIRRGALDYLIKPVEPEGLERLAKHALELSHLRRRPQEESDALAEAYGGWDVGVTPRMQKVEYMVNRFAPTPAGVMIVGPTGSGKERVAKALHLRSNRSKGPFMAINCAAVPPHLIESELFGHERGSFTGAIAARRGLIEQSHRGTLFLDEVTEMSLEMQAKLLRALEDHKIRRVGGDNEIQVDVRVVSATNRNVDDLVAEGKFREDLVYRLCVTTIMLPGLKDRAADIPFLAEKFRREYHAKNGSTVDGFAESALWVLMNHDWPGNIRMLRNAIERAMILAEGEAKIDVPHIADLAHAVSKSQGHDRGEEQASAGALHPLPRPASLLPVLPPDGLDMKAAGEAWERQMVEQALARTGGNQSAAARLLALTRDELRYRLDKYQREDAAAAGQATAASAGG